jgi:hypothetical protein
MAFKEKMLATLREVRYQELMSQIPNCEWRFQDMQTESCTYNQQFTL